MSPLHYSKLCCRVRANQEGFKDSQLVKLNDRLSLSVTGNIQATYSNSNNQCFPRKNF